MNKFLVASGLGACVLVLVASTTVPIPAYAAAKCDSVVSSFDPAAVVPAGRKICVDNAIGWGKCGGKQYYRRVTGGNSALGIERKYDCVKKK